MNSDQKGLVAVLKVQLRAWEKGADTYMPLNPSSRCDMILDWCGKLYRTQIKYAGGTATKAQGCAVVNLRKGDHSEKMYTSDEIDVLLFYVPHVDVVCWLGPEIFHLKTGVQIRFSPAKNGQKSGCVMVQDYIW